MKKTLWPVLTSTFILTLMLLTGCGSSGSTGITTITENLQTETPVVNQTPATTVSFILSSPEVADGGVLPADYTGDGSGATLPLEWSGAPAETQSYALIMHHLDPEGKTKWYWILYNIPQNVRSLPKNVKDIGTPGTNSVNGLTEYAPPHSSGPGEKIYIYTLYALSESSLELSVPAAQVDYDVMQKAMENHILATAEMKVSYTRFVKSD